MSVEQMRASISKVYDSWRWRNKVRDMADNQVIAIYYSFEKEGKLNQKPTRSQENNFHQMNLFESELGKGEIVHG